MTVYARSDVSCVALSKAHGGCGEVHSRPVVEGAPVKLWRLDCNSCEDHLRSDSLWSSTISEIPETYDEKNVREDQERRGQRDQADATANALAHLAKLGDLPTVLGKMVEMMTGQQPVAAIQAESALAQLCTNGHANAAHTKFCGECGVPLEDIGSNHTTTIVATPEITKAELITGTLKSDDVDPVTTGNDLPHVPTDYSSMTVAQLRDEVAARPEIQATARTRADLIQLLQLADEARTASDGAAG